MGQKRKMAGFVAVATEQNGALLCPLFDTQSVDFGAVGCLSPPVNVMLAANCRVGTRSEARPRSVLN
jgi:hypothetical protein